jgi:GT2 family glycosyltransferase
MAQDSAPLISIVIVSYNSKDELPACLGSIHNQHVPCEVFVVDNASTDGSQTLIEDYSRTWPAVKPIFNSENKGLAYANNQPMYMCTGEYILILNPDTILREGALRSLTDYLSLHDDVGIVGPKSFFEDGAPHVSYHRNWTIFHILLWKTVSHRIMRYLYDRLSDYRERDVLLISGACLMIRRELFIDIGGYDESFFLSVEDVADLCLRAKQRRYRTVFYPGAEVTHIGGRSHQGLDFLAMYYSFDGSLLFLRKHKNVLQTWLLLLFLVLTSLLKACYIALLTPFFPKRYGGLSKAYLSVVGALVGEYCLGAMPFQ